jgi:Domain of unknown function (DUF5655)
MEHKKLWKCPQCRREFEREGQSHSCKLFPLEQHFENKPQGKLLYKKFKSAIKQQVDPFKIESLECCIHFVSSFTFASAKIFKDKIEVLFGLGRKIKSQRINQCVQLPANRYLYYVTINTTDEIDDTLMEWIKEAQNKKTEKAVTV